MQDNPERAPSTNTIQPKDEAGGINLDFEEEPLGISSEYTFGYLDLQFGQKIGRNDEERYEVKRKLGFGRHSSVWLAFDTQESRFVAVKVFTVFATSLAFKGCILELEALLRISSAPGPNMKYCTTLLDRFFIDSKVEENGVHQCLVFSLYNGPVASFLKPYEHRAPVSLAKRILYHVLRGLDHVHKQGVAHTDLKPDNLLMDLGNTSRQEIENILARDPPRRYPPEKSWPPGKMVEVAVSQPVPFPQLDDAHSRSFLIGDLSSAQFVKEPITDEITSEHYRAPETILKGVWNQTVDIWAFGCLVFELITGSVLYKRQANNFTEDEIHIYEMMITTGERFEMDQLRESDIDTALGFLHPENTFLHRLPKVELARIRFEDMMKQHVKTDEEEIRSAGAFMERCMRLNPRHRPSAEELLKDPWWHTGASVDD